MKPTTKLLLQCFILLLTLQNYSQTTTVTINQSSLNYTNNGQSGESAGHCGVIDLELSTSTQVTMMVTLTRPTNLVVGNDSHLKVYTIRQDGDTEIQRASVAVHDYDWNEGSLEANASISIPAFTINADDYYKFGGKLFAVFENSSGAKYYPNCEYTIVKDDIPTFTLTPNNISLDCGSTASYTFTVTKSNNSQADFLYNWSANGWKRNGIAVSTFQTSENSITLTPASATTLPSNITVTPLINGIPQPSKKCIVSRSAIQKNGVISGPGQICTNGTVTISGTLSNQNINWTLSNSSVCSINTSTGSSITLTRIGTGLTTLTATVSNSCGQSYSKSIDIHFGLASPVSLLSASGVPYNSLDLPSNCDTNTTWIFKTYDVRQGAYQARITFTDSQNVEQLITKPINSYGYFTVTAEDLGMSYGSSQTILVAPVNPCGYPGRASIFHIYKPTLCQCGIGPGCNVGRVAVYNEEYNYKEEIEIFPNPATDILTVQIKTNQNQTDKSRKGSISIFNMLGQKTKQLEINSLETDIQIQDLQSGIYTLIIDYNGISETRKIIKQ